MIEVIKTDIFDTWLKKLKDRRAKSIIQVHLDRLVEENFGKVRALGKSVYEKKIDYGPGYRLYFINYEQHVVVLLCGGDKSSQVRDIKYAQNMAREVEVRG